VEWNNWVLLILFWHRVPVVFALFEYSTKCVCVGGRVCVRCLGSDFAGHTPFACAFPRFLLDFSPRLNFKLEGHS